MPQYKWLTILAPVGGVSPVGGQTAYQNCQRRFTFLLSDTSKKELINDNFLYDKLPPRPFPQHSGQVNLRGLMHACIKCHRPSRKLSSQWTLNCVERKMHSEWLYLMHHGCLKMSLPSISVVTLPSFYFLPMGGHYILITSIDRGMHYRGGKKI